MSRITAIASLFCALLTWPFEVQASKTLAVPTVSQLPQTNWCWAASAQAVLSFTGNAPGMCNIANWTRQRHAWGNDNCCTNGTGAICNQANWMYGTRGSLQNILSNWGANSDRYARSLSLSDVKEAIDDDSPIIVRWGWTAGGGHFVVLHGYSGSNTTIMDPWNGASTLSHANVTSTSRRNWTHTLVVRPKKVTYVVDDTGSMGGEIASVRSTLTGQVDGHKAAGTFAKYTMVTYKDSARLVGQTLNHDTVKGWVGALSASGGGDCPEAGYDALTLAADNAPDSDIWWFTDADSHGGPIAVLAAKSRLLNEGCTLHSTIFGSCSLRRPAEAGARYFDGQTCGSDDTSTGEASAMCLEVSRAWDGETEPSRRSRRANVSSYEAAEQLSLATGGLFFATTSSDADEATALILEQIESNVDIHRLQLPAGEVTSTFVADESLRALRVVLDVPVGGTGSLTLRDPDGNEVSPDDEGVRLLQAGASRMLVLTEPALKVGEYTVVSDATINYYVSVSGESDYQVELLSDNSGGIGGDVQITVSVDGLGRPGSPAGPGDMGPGGPLDTSPIPPSMRPFSRDDLQFFVERVDGSDRKEITLFDDGAHGDVASNDGIFGGTTNLTEGRYQIIAADGIDYQRLSHVVLIVSQVELHAPSDAAAAPGATVEHQFKIENLGSESRTFNVQAHSSASWIAAGGLPPASVTVDAASSESVLVRLAIPGGAESGDADLLTVTVLAQDDDSIGDSSTVRTTAWVGPTLQQLSPATVSPGDELELNGSGFGEDPGAGERSSDSHHVSVSGVRIKNDDVLSWADEQIRIRIPEDARGGLVRVVNDGEASNELELAVNRPPDDDGSDPCATIEAYKDEAKTALTAGELNRVVTRLNAALVVERSLTTAVEREHADQVAGGGHDLYADVDLEAVAGNLSVAITYEAVINRLLRYAIRRPSPRAEQAAALLLDASIGAIDRACDALPDGGDLLSE